MLASRPREGLDGSSSVNESASETDDSRVCRCVMLHLCPLMTYERERWGCKDRGYCGGLCWTSRWPPSHGVIGRICGCGRGGRSEIESCDLSKAILVVSVLRVDWGSSVDSMMRVMALHESANVDDAYQIELIVFDLI